MTTPHTDPQPKSIPVIAVLAAADRSVFQWPEYTRTVAASADPMQSETVKGWLKGSLGTPR